MQQPRWLIIALILAGGFSAARGATNKISSELENVPLRSNIDVIVQFDQAPTNTYHQKILSRGGKQKNRINMGRSGAYNMSAAAALDLANDPSVVHISPDH